MIRLARSLPDATQSLVAFESLVSRDLSLHSTGSRKDPHFQTICECSCECSDDFEYDFTQACRAHNDPTKRLWCWQIIVSQSLTARIVCCRDCRTIATPPGPAPPALEVPSPIRQNPGKLLICTLALMVGTLNGFSFLLLSFA